MATSTDQQYEFVLQGSVVDRVTRKPVPGVKVEAWDRDTRYHDMLGVATTDQSGRFVIGFQTVYFGDYAPDRSPDVFFKAFIDAREVLTTFETPQYNLERGTTTIVLELVMPKVQTGGVDRVNSMHALKAIDWWSQSDFRGVWEQGKDKSKSVGRLVGDLGAKSLLGVKIKPIQPAATKDSEIVNQSSLQAEKSLAVHGIQVTEVKTVDPKAAKNLMNLRDYPLALRSGDKVTLYEENGVVKYYTLTPKTKAAGVDAAKVVSIEEDVQAVKAQLREVETMRVEMDRIKETSQAAGQTLGEGSKDIQAQAAEISKLQTELATLRKNTAAKDAEIAKLRTDLDAVRTAQTNLTTNIPLSRLEALEKEIVRLRVAPERIVRDAPAAPIESDTNELEAPAMPIGRKVTAKKATTEKAGAKKTASKNTPAAKSTPTKPAAKKAATAKASGKRGSKPGSGGKRGDNA
ncbi:MAG: hypothetical protein IT473_02345 [Lysobacter sp.]|nr:hypothetical protein [Lysobacter sp.]